MKRTIKKPRFPRSLKQGSLSQRVLLLTWKILKETLKLPIRVIEFPYWLLEGITTTDIMKKFHGTYEAEKEWEAIKALRQLESSGHIKKKKEEDKIYLTKKGYLEVLRYQVQENRPKWDGKWRIIVFDILEEKRSQRGFLRNRLRWLGFKELQKSVWIFPYDTKDKIKELLNICRVEIDGDIRFLTVEKMEDDGDFKKEFNLV